MAKKKNKMNLQLNPALLGAAILAVAVAIYAGANSQLFQSALIADHDGSGSGTWQQSCYNPDGSITYVDVAMGTVAKCPSGTTFCSPGSTDCWEPGFY